jgi:hypothetical protein
MKNYPFGQLTGLVFLSNFGDSFKTIFFCLFHVKKRQGFVNIRASFSFTNYTLLSPIGGCPLQSPARWRRRN